MLIQFHVENFRSFRDEVSLNLIPAKGRQMHPEHVMQSTGAKKVEALPLAAIFGKNAGGKSNLIRAADFARRMIVNGVRGDAPIATRPFKLDPTTLNRPSRFEFIFTHHDVLYTYGFSLTTKAIVSEWLYANYSTRESMVFERTSDDGRVSVKVGAALAKTQKAVHFFEFVAQGTRPNQLFLNEAFERNVELLKPVYLWFREQLVVVNPDAEYFALGIRAHEDQDFAAFLGRFLKKADTGIERIRTDVEDVDLDELIPNMAEELREDLLRDIHDASEQGVYIMKGGGVFTIRENENGKSELLRLLTQHRRSDGDLIDFELNEESDGTQRLLHLAPILRDLLVSDRTYLVDELDRSLHPDICNLFINTFLKHSLSAHSNGQLIVTLHEATVLDEKSIRRDEFWVIDKKQGVSNLRSLSEFKVRSDLRLNKAYRDGRFGAVPLTGDPLDSCNILPSSSKKRKTAAS